MYWKKVVEALKTQIMMCSTEWKIYLHTAEEEGVLHAMDTSFFSLLEGTVLQRELQTSAYPLF